MHYRDAARVLAACAAYDKRTPSQQEAYTWGADLGEITADEAIAAVAEHYREDPDTWAKPGHIIAVVKRHRRGGLDRSAALEHQSLRRLDPDHPDYDRQVMAAIRGARQTAAESGAAIPTRAAALPSGVAGDRAETSQQYRARMRAEIDAAIAAHPPKVERPELLHRDADASPVVLAARERARAERARPRRGDPQPVAATFPHLPLNPPRSTGDTPR